MGYSHAVVKHPKYPLEWPGLLLRANIEIDEDGFELVIDNMGDIVYACCLPDENVEIVAKQTLADQGFTLVREFKVPVW